VYGCIVGYLPTDDWNNKQITATADTIENRRKCQKNTMRAGTRIEGDAKEKWNDGEYHKRKKAKDQVSVAHDVAKIDGIKHEPTRPDANVRSGREAHSWVARAMQKLMNEDYQ